MKTHRNGQVEAGCMIHGGKRSGQKAGRGPMTFEYKAKDKPVLKPRRLRVV